jgi:transposase-like protein
MRRHDKKLQAQLVDKWQASGEPKSDFATRHGIKRSTFYHWTRNLKRQSSINQPIKGFQAITIEEDTSIPSRPMAVIHYPSGVKLELHELPDPRFVKALVQ